MALPKHFLFLFTSELHKQHPGLPGQRLVTPFYKAGDCRVQTGHLAYLTKVSRLVTGQTPDLLTPARGAFLHPLPFTSFPEQTPNDRYVSITVLSVGEAERGGGEGGRGGGCEGEDLED